MAEPTLKFNNVKSVLNNKSSRGASNYQSKKYPTAYILYTTLAELPDSLADNALIFTTDTAELFVGTGSGIQRIKLGTEADLNPRLYLKILEAKEIYKNKIEAERDKSELQALIQELQDSVYSKAEIDDFITKDIDLDGIVDKLNLYTINKVNELLAEKAATVDVYTQSQVNDLVDTAKQEASDNLELAKVEIAETYATIADAATKTESADKETEIKNFVTENYLSKTSAASTYATIEQVNELGSNVDSKFETVNESIANNASEIESIKTDYVKTNDYVSDKEALETSISNINSALTNFKDEVYKKNEVFNKTEINDKVDALNSSINSLDEAKVNKDVYDEKLVIIDQNFNTIDENIRSLANRVYTKTEVDTKVSGAVNDLKEELENKITRVSSDVSNMGTEITAVEALANSAVKENEMNAAIAEAISTKADKTDLTSANSSIASLSQRVTNLEDKDVYTKAEVDAAIESAITAVIQQMREEFRI